MFLTRYDPSKSVRSTEKLLQLVMMQPLRALLVRACYIVIVNTCEPRPVQFCDRDGAWFTCKRGVGWVRLARDYSTTIPCRIVVWDRTRSGLRFCPVFTGPKQCHTVSLDSCTQVAEMPKHDWLTPKAIANRIKSKGLQKLRWYCQMCQKQCRDEVRTELGLPPSPTVGIQGNLWSFPK